MKKIKFILPLCLMLLAIASCKKDFLEKAPGVDLTENTSFSTKANLESFMASIYQYAMHSTFRYRNQANFSTTYPVTNTDVVHPTSDITDEGDASEAGFIATNFWNTGSITSSNIVSSEDYRYYIRWIAMRQIALVINRAKEVPALDPTATIEYVDQVIAEVKFLRALNYFEMIKRYGGVPIIDKVYDAGVSVIVPRSSLDSCIKFILKDCDDAIASPNLLSRYSASQTGRANKVAVYALKAKVLLYAASPQFNTATPYLSMPNPADNRLICLGNYDVNRWATAATAATAAITFARDNGYSLVDDPLKRKNNTLATIGLVNNYRTAWEVAGNTEFIMTYQGFGTSNSGNAPFTFINPSCYGSFWSGITVPLNFIKKYEDTLGNPVTWSASGGGDLLDMYGKLDRRFKQTMSYTESYYNSSFPLATIYIGGSAYNNCKGGVWERKYLPGVTGSFVLNDPIFRVNELFLNAAEAYCESGQLTLAKAFTDSIRIRSGQPPLPATLDILQQRQRIRNERAIELMFDDQRMWDIRRWLMADDGIMKGAMDGLQITRIAAGKYSWAPYTFETRVFNTNMYLHPFHLPEVQKGNLVQNPGW